MSSEEGKDCINVKIESSQRTEKIFRKKKNGCAWKEPKSNCKGTKMDG